MRIVVCDAIVTCTICTDLTVDMNIILFTVSEHKQIISLSYSYLRCCSSNVHTLLICNCLVIKRYYGFGLTLWL